MDLLLFISLTPKKLISPKPHGFYLMIPNTNAQNRVLLFLSLKFVYWAILSCSLTHDKALLMSYIFHAKFCLVKWTWSTNANNCALSNSAIKLKMAGLTVSLNLQSVRHYLCWKEFFDLLKFLLSANHSGLSERHFKYISQLTDKMEEHLATMPSFFLKISNKMCF